MVRAVAAGKLGATATADVDREISTASVPQEAYQGVFDQKQAELGQLRSELLQLETEFARSEAIAKRAARFDELRGQLGKVTEEINRHLADLIELELPARQKIIDSIGRELINVDGRVRFDQADTAETAAARRAIYASTVAHYDGSFIKIERKLLRAGWQIATGGLEFTVKTFRPAK